MNTFDGGCHCGNLSLRFETAKETASFSVRSCGCGFCRRHATRTISDPDGRVEIRVRDAARLNRYRFGSKSTDFLVCRECGTYLGALQEADGKAFFLVNTHALDRRDEFTQPLFRTDHDAEPPEARIARRTSTWTPATVIGA